MWVVLKGTYWFQLDFLHQYAHLDNIITCCCLKTLLYRVSTMQSLKSYVKTLDTIGNCQRSVFSLGVSQHMHTITTLWELELKRFSKWRDENGRKNTFVTPSCVLSDAWFRDLKFKSVVSKSNSWKVTYSSKNYSTSEGGVSHKVVYYQPFPNTRYQVRFHANTYFE